MYKVKQTEDKTAWNIIETETGNIMATAEKSSDPNFRLLLNNLKGGKGFRGWTPMFFLNKIDPKLLNASDNI